MKMENLEFIQIKSSIDFSNSLVTEEIVILQNLLQFMTEFKEIYDREKVCLPYHINLIDELHANENAHSRIFAKLLRFEEHGRHTFLEKFLSDVCKFKLTVEKPIVKKVDSCGRIDIPIFDKKYVVVIENKVTDKAPDQNNSNGGQLARYIETIEKDYGRVLEEIFVVYTPKYTREPSRECWKNRDNISYKSDFRQRFCSLSYRDVIYPWLKNDILPLIDKKDVYLRSAVEQYVDYLEGMFSLRKIDEEMNMKLQVFIKDKLGLEDEKPEEAIEVLSEKETELNNAITQIQQLKSKYKKLIILECFEKWEKSLILDFPDYKPVVDKFKSNKEYINIGVKFHIVNKDFTALIEWSEYENPNLYFGVGRHHSSSEKHEIPDILEEILTENELSKSNDFWYGWKYPSFDSAYEDFKKLIEKIDSN